MQKTSVLILILLFTGCVSPIATTTEKAQVPAPSTSTSHTGTMPTSVENPYLNCLSPAIKMNIGRAAHTATLLPDGKVLIAGGFLEEGTSEIPISSAEIFNPKTKTFTLTGDMNEPRDGHTAALLPNGKVLIVGGWNKNSRTLTAELYDPATGEFHYTAKMMSPRQSMTATLLQNGQVLIAGGDFARGAFQQTAELYDMTSEKFIPTGELNTGRGAHTATLLNDGRVLLVGGTSKDSVLASTEIYDPATGKFTLTGTANQVRYKHSAVLLQNGTVLIIGGSNENDWTGKYNSAEIYDPSTGEFIRISDMNMERFKLSDAALLLPDGNVLIGGGSRDIEIFDSNAESFIPGGTLDNDYFYSVSTLLKNGSVLITGGYDPNIQPSDKAWLYC